MIRGSGCHRVRCGFWLQMLGCGACKPGSSKKCWEYTMIKNQFKSNAPWTTGACVSVCPSHVASCDFSYSRPGSECLLVLRTSHILTLMNGAWLPQLRFIACYELGWTFKVFPCIDV